MDSTRKHSNRAYHSHTVNCAKPAAATSSTNLATTSAYNMSPQHAPTGSPKIALLEQQHPPLKFARQHNVDIPNQTDPEYAHYKSMRHVALANAVNELWKDLSSRSAVEHLEIESEKLIVRHYSQSKLSQQELADLQKATHFDKKELQQWYKGVWSLISSVGLLLKHCRFPEGLPIRHAH